MKTTTEISSTASGTSSWIQILAQPGHPIWGMLGLVVRLGVIGGFVFGATWLTSTDYGISFQDEGGHDLITWLVVGGWSEYQRRRPVVN
jgi:hypothetical protein